jgi:hypothetical protein
MYSYDFLFDPAQRLTDLIEWLVVTMMMMMTSEKKKDDEENMDFTVITVLAVACNY